MWRSLTEEKKIPYAEAAKRRNDAQQMERQKIDEKIIQLRPGARDYRGYKITPLPSNLLEKDKVIASKRGLNPVSWYHWSEHQKNVQNPNYIWKNYYLRITIEANSTWPSLTEQQKKMFIHRAKVEYRKFTGSDEGNEVIDSILKESLEEHAACGYGKRLATEYSSDTD
ncbi:hypothetical protein DAPPUDRAFT_301778 [Daphnia pulex]|uniref:Uncharacterized protein n=1 Tax=Daphnia pulex TaxID=6669 RepID=E9HK66_DAPPU|nr:hypothetical protein DAPPUDRAFT_301778 [Daphnia pulex]|eukprot:EFX67885.1 hypothetical protein DAPPUDRAFT_301778 [Daphnia pulex]